MTGRIKTNGNKQRAQIRLKPIMFAGLQDLEKSRKFWRKRFNHYNLIGCTMKEESVKEVHRETLGLNDDRKIWEGKLKNKHRRFLTLRPSSATRELVENSSVSSGSAAQFTILTKPCIPHLDSTPCRSLQAPSTFLGTTLIPTASGSQKELIIKTCNRMWMRRTLP